MAVHPVSIVIPTYGRDSVLVDTIGSLLALKDRAEEIIVVDQTQQHEESTRVRLDAWNRQNEIRWIRVPEPSICKAMNRGLRIATSPYVLFLDDDIRPRAEIVSTHTQAHLSSIELWATVGQVIQPWQSPEPLAAPRSTRGLRLDEDFPFHSTQDHLVFNVMAGNLCVHRERALSIGGFDENFRGAAYRFETDFARRIHQAGGTIKFLGQAGIDHLRVNQGGTRTAGSHLTSASPDHGVGDHYYAMLHGESRWEALAYSVRRALREVRTKFHLTHPWWIPVKLVGEARAYFAALKLVRSNRETSR